MPVFAHPEYDGHEAVVYVRDAGTGLRGIIALHDTTLGPALGGTRMWGFEEEDEALEDVLRLSKGMTYKAALAGVPHGGGKSVIIGDPRRDKTPALIAAFATAVDHLGGRYIMAEDVGTTEEDMDEARRHTRHVSGTSDGLGDPSAATARGVLAGIKAAMSRLGRPELTGARVAVQGVGNVGLRLCGLLHDAGARLVVADVDEKALTAARQSFGAEIVAPDDIYGVEADIFAPCALGAVLNDRTVPRLRARVVAGSANNQLATPQDDVALKRRGIVYAPDYVINAGGLIQVSAEISGGSREDALRRADGLGATLQRIFSESDETGLPTGAVADRMARRILAEAARRHAETAAGMR